jgi:hypothetical protein
MAGRTRTHRQMLSALFVGCSPNANYEQAPHHFHGDNLQGAFGHFAAYSIITLISLNY